MSRSRVALPGLVRDRAERTPDAIAVHDVDAGLRCSWAELYEAGVRWASCLTAQGVTAGCTVVTMLPPSHTAYACWLGCSLAGAIEVPANTAYRGAWLQHVLNNSGAGLVVVAARYVGQVLDVVDNAPSVDRIVVPDSDDISEITQSVGPPISARVELRSNFLAGASTVATLHEPEERDVACVIYTSGTTGPSKGVMVPWGQLNEGVHSGYIPARFRQGDIQYAPYPTYHVSGREPIYSAAMFDGSVVVRDHFRTDAFWNDVRRFGCTSTLLVGPTANFLYRQPPHDDDRQNPLRHVVMAPVIPEIEQFKDRFGVEVFTAYNMTEISVPIMSSNRPITASNWRSCGQPRGGSCEVRLVDEQDYPITEPGVVGELTVRMNAPWRMSLGYLNMPDQTVDAWRNGWFHTGDSFHFDETGEWYFIDRAKDYIRRRGENISSFEVEAAINSYPGVHESAAVAVRSSWGEDEIQVFVVPAPGTTIALEALVEYLIPRMPRFALPRFFELVDELPKTPTLRTQKAKLRERGVGSQTWDREAVRGARSHG